MKKISKLFAAAVVAPALFISTGAKAQTVPANTFHFDIGAEAGISQGTIKIASNYYVGATGRLSYGLSDRLAATLTSGYYNFIGNHYHASMGMIPIKAGLKYSIWNGFYVSAEAGVGIELQNFAVFPNLDNGIPHTTKFLFSPGVGYAVKNWDFSFRYENFSGGDHYYSKNAVNYGLLGLRIAHGFGK